MELLVNEEKRELKSHGTFQFPVNISRKRLSSYGTGAFPWHWHDEVELTLVLSGKDRLPRQREPVPTAGRERACSATPTPFTPAAVWTARTATMCPSPSTPGCWRGYEGCISAHASTWTAWWGPSPSLRLSPQESWQRHILEAVEKIYQLSQSQPETYELEVQRLLLGIWSGLYRHRENQAAAPAGPGAAGAPAGHPLLPARKLRGENHPGGRGQAGGPVQKRVLPVFQAADAPVPVRLPAGLPRRPQPAPAGGGRRHRGGGGLPGGVLQPGLLLQGVPRQDEAAPPGSIKSGAPPCRPGTGRRAAL